jgi:tetratricopeptide (TPR) repeat protein
LRRAQLAIIACLVGFCLCGGASAAPLPNINEIVPKPTANDRANCKEDNPPDVIISACKIIVLDPLIRKLDLFMALTDLSRAYDLKGDYGQAVQYASGTIDTAPSENLGDSYYNRSIYEVHAKMYQAALDDTNRALNLNPTDAAIQFVRGLAYTGLENELGAITSFSTAIMLNASYEDAYLNRGLLYLKYGDKADAIEDFKHVLSLDPSSQQAQGLLKVSGAG